MNHHIHLEQIEADPNCPRYGNRNPKVESIRKKKYSKDEVVKPDLRSYPTPFDVEISWKTGIIITQWLAKCLSMQPDAEEPAKCLWFYEPFCEIEVTGINSREDVAETIATADAGKNLQNDWLNKMTLLCDFS